MKQFKLVIKEDFTEKLHGLLVSEAQRGWKLNSLESSKSAALEDFKNQKQQFVLVFEK